MFLPPLLYLALLADGIGFVLRWILFTIVFFIAGRIVSGVNTTFTDAVVVAFIGSVVSSFVHLIFHTFLLLSGLSASLFWLPDLGSALITIAVYIPLFVKFFDTRIFGAIAIGMMCVVFYIIIGIFTTLIDITLQLLFTPP